jgi:hypothetical protein
MPTTSRTSSLLLAAVLASLPVGVLGCQKSAKEAFNSPAKTTPRKRLPDGSIDDQSKCDYKARKDRDVIETAGPGSVLPNVRRVFAVVGQGQDRQRVLVCREIDTNLDGTKDVVRKYNEKGESLFEEADTNFDGRIDTWITFAKGRIAEMKVDQNYDGNADEWKFYSAGKLTRSKRDTNFDSKADVWEMYGPDGRLERMGVDVDKDERVDRWDYDTDIRRVRETKERADEEAAAQKAAEKAEAERKAGEYKVADEDDKGDKKKKERKPAAKKGQEKPNDEPKAP